MTVRVAFTLSVSTLGNVNYFANLFRSIASRSDSTIVPVLFVGEQVDLTRFDGAESLEVVRARSLDHKHPVWIGRKVMQLVAGRDFVLPRLLKDHGIDVLSHSDPLGGRDAVPTLCWLGDFQHRTTPQFFSAQERRYRDRDFHQQCRWGTRVLVSSEDARHELANFDERGLAKARVLRFVAGVRTDATPADELRVRYGIDGPYFHLPNQYWAHKNHEVVVRAVQLLRSRGERVTVVSTGSTDDYRDPEFFGRFEEMLAASGVETDYRVLGVVPYADVLGMMRASVAVINPSRAEGWSTSVEESKSIGKRMIVSDLPVHREQDPPDAVYVDADDVDGFADAMLRVRDEFDEGTEAARQRAAGERLPSRLAEFARTYERIVLEVVEAS